jgi:hypothetical protein
VGAEAGFIKKSYLKDLHILTITPVLLSGPCSLAVSLKDDHRFNKPFLIQRHNNATLLEEGGLKGLSLWPINKMVQWVTHFWPLDTPATRAQPRQEEHE